MKRIIKYKDKEVEGTVVSFSTEKEDWNVYLLNDGATIKMKAIATEIFRIDGEFNDRSEPVYLIHSQNIVVSSNVPEHLLRKK